MIRRTIAAVALPALLAALPAAADLTSEPERLPALGRSVAGTDDATAVLQNPANLAFLGAPELRWQGIYLGDGARVPYQGHAFTLGVPLPLSLGAALRLDLIDPPAGSLGGLSSPYEWLTFGLGLQGSEAFSVGLSLQRSYSEGQLADGLGSYTLAASARPGSFLGLSLVARHVNGPLDGVTARRLALLGGAGVALGPSVTTALALRPLGTSALELGLEARAVLEDDAWEPRGTLGLDLPEVGRLRGEVTWLDPGGADEGVMAAGSLTVNLNGPVGSTSLAGGGLGGSAVDGGESGYFWNEIAFHGHRQQTGLGTAGTAARIRIESTPGPREHVALLRRLWGLSEESDVSAVGLVLRAAPADSLAHAQELRDAIRLLRARGKRVLCHLEDGAGAALYVCASADRVLVSPAGGVRFAGLKTRRIYFASLLEKLGVRAEFVRIGAHKSAPEAFTERAATDVARNDAVDLLQQSERWLAGDLAADRRIAVPEVRRRLAAGPFLAEEARAAGFADAVAFDDEVEKALSDLAGRRVELLDEPHAPRAPARFGRQRSIALVYVDGDIVDGRSRSIPLVGMDLAGSYTLAETLAEVRKDPNVGAVVLRVESPGGSSLASDVIWREVALTARVKPVVASFGQVAASGGYYVAAPATRIFANPLSITGSIGVFYGKADASGLLSKIGIDVETYKTTPRADADSLFRPFSPDERTELERKVAQIYGLFVARVAEGRKLSREAVDAVAQGRVWTGEQARDRGLVDELGGIRQALTEARSLAGLRADAPIVELPRLRTSLIGKLLGVEGLQAPLEGVALPAGLTPLVRAVLPLAIHAGDVPLARLELEPVEP